MKIKQLNSGKIQKSLREQFTFITNLTFVLILYGQESYLTYCFTYNTYPVSAGEINKKQIPVPLDSKKIC